MRNKYLLPHSYRKVGWFLFVPCAILGILSVHFEFELAFLAVENFRLTYDSLLESADENFTNELAASGVLISLVMIAFSREKIEDEFVMQLRLESLIVAVLINYALLLIAIIGIYGLSFFIALVYNMYTVLILFIIRFTIIKRKYERAIPAS